MNAPATRRGLLGASAAMVLAGAALPAVASTNPDAELLAVLAEFDALEAAIYPKPDPTAGLATLEEEQAWDDQVRPLHARQDALLERLCELETHTLEGFRARARTLLGWAELFMRDLQNDAAAGYWPQRMQIAFYRDLVGERPA